MLRTAADVEDAAVDLGMKGLDAAIEHLGEAGEIADVADVEASVTERARGAAGRDEFDAVAGEGAGEIDKAGLVCDGQKGTADGLQAGCGVDGRGGDRVSAHTIDFRTD